MVKLRFFKSKLGIFTIQILSLSLLIFLFNYKFKIDFDDGILKERKIIIQFLANYVCFSDLNGFLFLYSSWLLISFIPIIIYKEPKKAYSMNLTTFFFPNFFFYVFLFKYSPNYYNSTFHLYFNQTLFLGVIIVIYSLLLSIFFKKIMQLKITSQREDLEQIAKENRIVCPHCGIEFNSIPKYCYNCSKKIKEEIIHA
ncbi:MAG: hypothetical protein ACTSQJ_07120 [Promethearchaeota archaeon]